MNESFKGVLAIMQFQAQQKMNEAMINMCMQPQIEAVTKATNEEIRARAELIMKCHPDMDVTEAFNKAKETLADKALPA